MALMGTLRPPEPLARMGNPRRWALDPSWAFLNHGSFGARPRAVLALQRAWRDRFEAHPIRFLDESFSQRRIEAALAAMGRFLKVKPEGLVFLPNLTDAVATVLGSAGLDAGDEILTTSHAYGAVRRAIEATCNRTGARARVVELPCPLEGPQQALSLITDGINRRTRLAVLDQITSPSALRLPLEPIIAALRQRDIPVFVDGAHAGGMLADPCPSGATWWSTNLHKWALAPVGCAVLHTARSHRGRTRPIAPSHYHFKGYAQAFGWQGTRDISPWLTAPDAVNWVRDNGGWGPLRRHNVALARWAGQRLQEAWGTPVSAPLSMREGLSMVTVQLPAEARRWRDPLALRDALARRHKVEAAFWKRGRSWWVRLGAQACTRTRDVERLLEGLNDLFTRPVRAPAR